MKILRAKDQFVGLNDLIEFFIAKDIPSGSKFAISWKRGKRRKLRAYRVVNWWKSAEPEYSDHFVQLSRNGQIIDVFDVIKMS